MWGGGLGRIHPLPQKLAYPAYFPLFCPQKFNFVICMQFLAIMPPTLVETKWGNLKKGESEKNECLGGLKEFLPQTLGWLTMFLVSEVFVK